MQPDDSNDKADLFKCPGQPWREGSRPCPGVLKFLPGQMVTQCSKCKMWKAVTDPKLVAVSSGTGASEGTAGTMMLFPNKYGQAYLKCSNKDCHYRKEIVAYAIVLDVLLATANEHSCPTPKPEEPENLPSDQSEAHSGTDPDC